MQLPRRPLIALFRDVPPASIFYSRSPLIEPIHSHSKVNSEILSRCIQHNWTTRSGDEIRSSVEYLVSKIIPIGTNQKRKTIFSLLASYGKRLLDLECNKVQIHEAELLKWRDVSLQLGSDLFTTSVIALNSTHLGSSSPITYFDWPQVLLTNDLRFKNLISKGLYENHSHLNAIGDVFQPAWTSLMNRIVGREAEFDSSGIARYHLGSEIHPDLKIPNPPLIHLVKLAAFARVLIWEMIIGKIDDLSEWNQLWESFMNRPSLEFNHSRIIQNRINNWIQPGSELKRIDYTLSEDLEDSIHSKNLANIGERRLMFEFFSGLFRGDDVYFSFADLFYFYTIVKCKFRMELVQSNGVIGFSNFYQYQNRKDQFVENDAYLSHARTYFAAVQSKSLFNILGLDLRFRPDTNYEKLASGIRDKTNKITNPPQCSTIALRNPLKVDIPNYWLTAHFIKKQEYTPKAEMIALMTPRHQRLREEVRLQTQAIVQLRMNRNQGSYSLKAVDGANSEIGCRPEVFAQAIRCLREHELEKESHARSRIRRLWSDSSQIDSNDPPMLKIKFHCGEEFLDLVDGLRAIDETIHFLDIQPKEYLGHVLALGTNVLQWYARKPHTLFLPVQDIIDNLVWLIGTAQRFAILSFPNEIMELTELAVEHIHETYPSIGVDSDKGASTIINDFYSAWKLRGDNPFCYSKSSFASTSNIATLWSKFERNPSPMVPDSLRSNPRVFDIVQKYHFSPSAKYAGERIASIRYSRKQQLLIAEVQEALLEDVRNRNLFIETLPSINVQLSAFKRYDEHVILRFFPPRKAGWTGPKLNVSICSDNPGVIESNATTELSFMIAALKKAMDERGDRIYTDETIYTWIEAIIDNGREQAENILNPAPSAAKTGGR